MVAKLYQPKRRKLDVAGGTSSRCRWSSSAASLSRRKLDQTNKDDPNKDQPKKDPDGFCANPRGLLISLGAPAGGCSPLGGSSWNRC